MAIEETLISSAAIIGAAFIAFYGIPYKIRKDAKEHDRTARANAKERDRTALADKKYDLFFPAAKNAISGLWGLTFLISQFTTIRSGDRRSSWNLLKDLTYFDYPFVKSEIWKGEIDEAEEEKVKRLHLLLQEHVMKRQLECGKQIGDSRAAFMLLSNDQGLGGEIYECEIQAMGIIDEIVFREDGPRFDPSITQPKIDAFITNCDAVLKRIREELERIRAPSE